MKKCFIISKNGLGIGGVERVCLYLDQVISKLDYEVVVIDRHRVKKLWLAKVFPFMASSSKFFSILSSIYIKKYKQKNDIAIANGFNAPFIHADLLFIHGTLVESRKIVDKKNSLFYIPAIYEKIACRNAKIIVCVSNATSEEVKKYYLKNKDKKIIVVNNPVDTDLYFPNKKDYDDQEIIILFSGVLSKRKGVDKLIELAIQIESMPNIKLHIGTMGTHNTKYFTNFKNTKISIGLQHHEMNQFYNSGHVLYFPSSYEGFEMVTLEALACGIPVVGYMVGAIKELYDNNTMGIFIAQKENIAKQLLAIAHQFNTGKSKEELHNFCVKHYSIPTYHQQINELLNIFSK